MQRAARDTVSKTHTERKGEAEQTRYDVTARTFYIVTSFISDDGGGGGGICATDE